LAALNVQGFPLHSQWHLVCQWRAGAQRTQ
jgi:hypothetical protein